MNILITVGTTPFNSLFRVLDNMPILSEREIIGQRAVSDYIPANFLTFEFDTDFEKHIVWADVVVTHAGAGSVFKLLERGKKCIVVANLERIDKHQEELAKFVSSEGYALSTASVEDVPKLLKNIEGFVPRKYEKTTFFEGHNLTETILSYYK